MGTANSMGKQQLDNPIFNLNRGRGGQTQQGKKTTFEKFSRKFTHNGKQNHHQGKQKRGWGLF